MVFTPAVVSKMLSGRGRPATATSFMEMQPSSSPWPDQGLCRSRSASTRDEEYVTVHDVCGCDSGAPCNKATKWFLLISPREQPTTARVTVFRLQRAIVRDGGGSHHTKARRYNGIIYQDSAYRWHICVCRTSIFQG